MNLVQITDFTLMCVATELTVNLFLTVESHIALNFETNAILIVGYL